MDVWKHCRSLMEKSMWHSFSWCSTTSPGDVVEHQEKECHIDFSIRERQCFQTSITDVDVLDAVKSLSRGRQHRTGFVDRDHALDERREGLRDRPGATAQVGHDPRFIE